MHIAEAASVPHFTIGVAQSNSYGEARERWFLNPMFVRKRNSDCQLQRLVRELSALRPQRGFM